MVALINLMNQTKQTNKMIRAHQKQKKTPNRSQSSTKMNGICGPTTKDIANKKKKNRRKSRHKRRHKKGISYIEQSATNRLLVLLEIA